MMKVGDIYLVDIPSSGGHEQAGIRPAIIAQSAGSEKLPTVLIIPLTSKLRASEFPFSFLIDPDQCNNLNVTSVALIFQLRAIDKKRLRNNIGRLDSAKVQLLRQQLREIMGLGD